MIARLADSIWGRVPWISILYLMAVVSPVGVEGCTAPLGLFFSLLDLGELALTQDAAFMNGASEEQVGGVHNPFGSCPPSTGEHPELLMVRVLQAVCGAS